MYICIKINIMAAIKKKNQGAIVNDGENYSVSYGK